MTVSEALEQVRAHGGRVTPQKRAIIQLLASRGNPVSAPELCEELHERFPEMAADTVYRNLQGLVGIGAVEVFHVPDRADRFEWVEYHHHHAVCLGCGSVTCLEPCTGGLVPSGPSGFRPVRHEFQLFGYCDGCDVTTAAEAAPSREEDGA
ncbi:Fur family transcriptional regulator [Limnochorda pilosa]|uniref:Fur family transcriptional regulator n=1 Tax=Limnochorda pilosa TaxID=1555112 RepID=A0A0K2SHE5_LIMPI|nr:Fur family transcriptional regulator [Limnochorda pilosa]BAS26538.1 Fur family transcriptional regulator [Limnochorda pilosa]